MAACQLPTWHNFPAIQLSTAASSVPPDPCDLLDFLWGHFLLPVVYSSSTTELRLVLLKLLLTFAPGTFYYSDARITSRIIPAYSGYSVSVGQISDVFGLSLSHQNSLSHFS